jgi:adenylate kinase family enzyme
LGVPFVELDALVHGPGWEETSDDLLREQVQAIVASDGWVIDGTYLRKLGTLVLDGADLILWLDLPIRMWMPRLLRRTFRRLRTREELWNGNTESLRDAFWGRNSLFGYALQTHFQRRREWPAGLGERPFIRLRTPAQVRAFLESAPSGR